jgi:hypothetical protein
LGAVKELGKSRLAGLLFGLFLRLLYYFASALLFFPGLFSLPLGGLCSHGSPREVVFAVRRLLGHVVAIVE